uniref:Transmembrane protein n=1 Tax=Chromera velia CCMP2878 TaxID=1169474 RepID=A0A0G4G800_9ALVE|eukprot:Cvel_20598.t1-p1 / transcript=Cvel_20598.t1 / gene=Cvel_20598 / organism=Chromera_velia_CCMP2878 / gene_product=hypothetical protein / transcript_product=hypothetical protein / location=Cvel_scaffold1862:25510-27959(+) / protein_length=441 / sequence_SO=supercontig / SO=protein_coding / is_pseudo=false
MVFRAVCDPVGSFGCCCCIPLRVAMMGVSVMYMVVSLLLVTNIAYTMSLVMGIVGLLMGVVGFLGAWKRNVLCLRIFFWLQLICTLLSLTHLVLLIVALAGAESELLIRQAQPDLQSASLQSLVVQAFCALLVSVWALAIAGALIREIAQGATGDEPRLQTGGRAPSMAHGPGVSRAYSKRHTKEGGALLAGERKSLLRGEGDEEGEEGEGGGGASDPEWEGVHASPPPKGVDPSPLLGDSSTKGKGKGQQQQEKEGYGAKLLREGGDRMRQAGKGLADRMRGWLSFGVHRTTGKALFCLSLRTGVMSMTVLNGLISLAAIGNIGNLLDLIVGIAVALVFAFGFWAALKINRRFLVIFFWLQVACVIASIVVIVFTIILFSWLFSSRGIATELAFLLLDCLKIFTTLYCGILTSAMVEVLSAGGEGTEMQSAEELLATFSK